MFMIGDIHSPYKHRFSDVDEFRWFCNMDDYRCNPPNIGSDNNYFCVLLEEKQDKSKVLNNFSTSNIDQDFLCNFEMPCAKNISVG
jgi:hypothetical protein